MRKIGYARVSTGKQNLDLQISALEEAGCDEIFSDKNISGAAKEKPGLEKALSSLQEGDTLVVWKLDRLGRTMSELAIMLEGFEERGIHFRSTTQGINTSDSVGRLIFHIMAAFAEMERELIKERTEAGLEAARQNGRFGGRPSLDLEDERILKALDYHEKGIKKEDIAKMLGVHQRTIYRWIKMATQNIEGFV